MRHPLFKESVPPLWKTTPAVFLSYSWAGHAQGRTAEVIILSHHFELGHCSPHCSVAFYCTSGILRARGGSVDHVVLRLDACLITFSTTDPVFPHTRRNLGVRYLRYLCFASPIQLSVCNILHAESRVTIAASTTSQASLCRPVTLDTLPQGRLTEISHHGLITTSLPWPGQPSA
jgi:hypothetical protein